ncbi:type II toxin-antitoxin system HicA family toxin [Candidatus Acetothermia bacterium]|jgi:predicted RNA binding protein YcfA (HicA-like mRNA interferase family)|nr:type II toxin-antitoxin system HicA family toxin [Candidatus Acetothermia bacterium]MCI2431969.1 type II toxin-antitoxin system HicA family toxin [Candidatus Acetothermia bacterium]MCI2437469.1 type II toxin-antitoxin system HicA family toxin [Candidatus Acetothermia bacterium]
MPEKLPQVSGRRVAQAFARAGWTIREEGPHIILTKAGVRYNLSVPNHRSLKKGTLRSLIRKAGLTIAEFIQLLS